MKTLDIVIIADRFCPTSRTYITYLDKAGFRAKEILLVDFIGSSKKSLLCRRLFGSKIANALISLFRPEWPEYSEKVRSYCIQMQSAVEHPIDYTTAFDYSSYSDSVRRVVATDYDDPCLQEIILSSDCPRFLYTNGGRVPAVLLNNDKLKIFHIHPGVVPHIRGSDGLLWSLAVRKKPGVSCFYMDEGIDTGALIGTKEFCCPQFSIPVPQTDEDEDAFYRALLLAYDPHLRASLFRDIVVKVDGGIMDIEAINQSHDPKDNYLWMHSKLRKKIIAEVLCNA